MRMSHMIQSTRNQRKKKKRKKKSISQLILRSVKRSIHPKADRGGRSSEKVGLAYFSILICLSCHNRNRGQISEKIMQLKSIVVPGYLFSNPISSIPCNATPSQELQSKNVQTKRELLYRKVKNDQATLNVCEPLHWHVCDRDASPQLLRLPSECHHL